MVPGDPIPRRSGEADAPCDYKSLDSTRPRLQLVPDAPTPIGPTIEQLYREHFDDVLRLLALLGAPIDAREDLTQEVFIVAHRRLDDYEDEGSHRAWLYGIARRVLSQYRRTQFRERRKRVAWMLEPPPGQQSLDGVIENAEAAEIVEAFLDTLDAKQREAFVLGAIQGLGRVEMAQVMRVSPGTAYSRLRLARARFKERVLDLEEREVLLRKWRWSQTRAARALPMLLAWPFQQIQALATASQISVLAKSLALGLVAAIPTAAVLMATTPKNDPKPESLPAALQASHAASSASPMSPRRTASPSPPASRPTSLAVQTPSRVEVQTPEVRPAQRPRARTEVPRIEDEVNLLRVANRAREAGDNRGALRVLEQHANEFPRGRLAVDREFMRGLIRCEANSGDPIRTVQAFEARFPHSPQVLRLREACAREPQVQRPSAPESNGALGFRSAFRTELP